MFWPRPTCSISSVAGFTAALIGSLIYSVRGISHRRGDGAVVRAARLSRLSAASPRAPRNALFAARACVHRAGSARAGSGQGAQRSVLPRPRRLPSITQVPGSPSKTICRLRRDVGVEREAAAVARARDAEDAGGASWRFAQRDLFGAGGGTASRGASRLASKTIALRDQTGRPRWCARGLPGVQRRDQLAPDRRRAADARHLRIAAPLALPTHTRRCCSAR